MTPSQNEIWLLIGLFGVAIPLIALARRANISYPIILVLAGLALGFIPRLPVIELDPNLVLVIFLPPLLYWEAITAPTDVIRANAGQIWALALGLVVATTVVVAMVTHATISNMGWALAFVLGALVAPTDELAAAPVLERMRMPRHVIAIVEGESLLNDASALILYGAALTAAVTGVFHPAQGLLEFVVSALGGIALGLLAGWLAVKGWQWITDTQLQGVISFVTPFLAYTAAQRFGVSGVLAVVFAGIYVNRRTPVVITPEARLIGTGFWNLFVFLSNTLLFLLVGLQLHRAVQYVLVEYNWTQIIWYVVVVNVTVIGVRFVWTLAQEYLPTTKAGFEHPEGDWKHALVVAWSGMRGAVSLAAALALPVSVAGGLPLGHRHLIIFLTFSVILVTLVGGGLTLPLVIKWLNIPPGDEEREDRQRGVAAMSEAALLEIDRLEKEGKLDAERARALRHRYEYRRRIQRSPDDGERDAVAAERQVLAAERNALIALRERGEIDNTVLRELQRRLDIDDEHARHHLDDARD